MNIDSKFGIVVPWHNPKQRDEFLSAWGVLGSPPPYLFLQQDTDKSGCAVTKNRGIRRALDAGCDYIVVLDDDCYPHNGPEQQPTNLHDFAHAHIRNLRNQPVRKVYPTMFPNPRGMPYRNLDVMFPVAASIGLWSQNPDLDALYSLVCGNPPPEFQLRPMTYHGDFFPFSGMNFCFHKDWADCAVLIDVPRFDDIWMGWIWEKVAYDRGHAFSTKGPLVRHARQSNVWQNLEDEAKYLATNEGLWSAIYSAPKGQTPDELRHIFLGPKFGFAADLPVEMQVVPGAHPDVAAEEVVSPSLPGVNYPPPIAGWTS